MSLYEELASRRAKILAKFNTKDTKYASTMTRLYSELLPNPDNPEHLSAANRLKQISVVSTVPEGIMPIDGCWFRVIKKNNQRCSLISGESHKPDELTIIQIQSLNKGQRGCLPTGATYLKFEKLARQAGIKKIKILRPEYIPVIQYHSKLQNWEVVKRIGRNFSQIAKENGFSKSRYFWHKDLN